LRILYSKQTNDMKHKYWIFTLALALLFVGADGYLASKGSVASEKYSNISNIGNNNKQDDDIISTILQSIPSPLELSQLIKEVGTDYNLNFLNASTSVNNYNTSYRQALNLGIYSTDLGYCNLYNKNQDILNYLSSVKDLANDLGIGQYFDAETIKKLVGDRNNLEALINTTQQNFEKINTHLREEKREYQSVLLLTGGWVESVYITTLVHKQTKAKGGAKVEKLKEKIGEQKLTLEQLVLVLEIYKSKPSFDGLVADFKELQKIYNRVQIVTKQGPSTTVIVNGAPETTGGTITTVTMSDADLELIAAQLANIRNKIIK
jgi:hypothetical protein